jgi:sialic acid synthase SpsE
LLIAEIGNCHFGDLKRAKELIRAANESGADLIKGQAYIAKHFNKGSMPRSFYEDCAFSIDQYIDLIDYARSIGNDLFYSIFSPGMERISFKQKWHKIAGIQTKEGKADEEQDLENMIISVPCEVSLDTLYRFKNAEVLYVSQYLSDDPDLEYIDIYSKYFKRKIGYSDHTMGLKWCLEAIHKYQVDIIEKHFCMRSYEAYGSVVFRDTIHGITPKLFEKLALAMNN